MPGGVLEGAEDGEFLVLFGVVGGLLSLLHALELGAFGGGDGGGCVADVVAGGCEVGFLLCRGGEEGVLHCGRLFEDFEPDVFGPVRGDDCDHEGLQLDVFGDKGGVHADAGGFGGFAVEISGCGEVVEAIFEGSFVVCELVLLTGFFDENVELIFEELVP